MRQLYLLLITLLFSFHASSQCTVTLASVNNANCGANNGSVTLMFSGGVAPYYVNFSGLLVGSPQGQPLVIPNLAPGGYGFSVTDASSVICTGSANVTISSWGNPIQVNFTISHPTCPTCTDGSIQTTISGGLPPYFYQWSNGSTLLNQSGLGAGIYVLYVYDSTGCSSADTVVLSYGGANIYSISGKAYYDIDNDSAFGINDIPLAQQQIEKQPSGQIFYTDQNGDYILGDTSNAVFSLTHLSTNGFSVSDGVTSHGVVVGAANLSGLNFNLAPDSMFHSISASTFTVIPRCNSSVAFQTCITNQGTYIDSGSVTFNFDPLMTYTNSNPAGVVSGNSITFTYSNLLPMETRTFFSTYLLPGAGNTMYTSTHASTFDGSGSLLSTDTNLNAFVVLCSWDPNDKEVSPIGVGANHQVFMDEELRYLIRFQNTGNDTAFNIIVTDTISPKLNINSLFVISTSHLCWIEKIGGELMRFHFDDILLPDSNVNEPASHGYIYFRIKGSQTNPDPTVVTNSANIYFDFNPPVITNSTLTTFSNSTVGIAPISGKEAGTIRLSPHPMNESTLLLFDGIKDHTHLLELMDISGRTVIPNISFKGTSYLLQRESLSSGTYFIKITDIQNKALYYTKMVVR
ncbi:MAG: SprB repeat-containing protein [Bacteroidetes bacterium]|nr:SprB repeat-containing protein [Bacteroidota bacterium]